MNPKNLTMSLARVFALTLPMLHLPGRTAARRRSTLQSLIYTWLALLTCAQAHAAITFKQGTYSDPPGPQSTVTVTYANAQTAGDLNVVIVGWYDTTSSVSSVTDSKGNTYSRAIGPTVNTSQPTSQSVYYARNIAAAAAGSNVVTVTFNTAVLYPDIRVVEYSGVDTVSPLHAAVGASGSGTTTSSGPMNVTVSNALLVAANYIYSQTTGPGTGFTSRMISNPDGQIVEDRIVTSAGSYTGTAPQGTSGWWIMQMVAFKAASSDTQAPSAPASLTATTASSSQINLSWTASTDNVGVTGYRVERCSVANCTTFAQIATPTATTYNNTGLTGSTSYSYRVLAQDAAGNLSAYSNTASATTQTADTTAPSVPGSLGATAASSTQINLAWTASTDNVGVTGYQIDRCQSAGCSNFTQVGTSATTTFNNTGLTGSTSYSYRVRATDAAGNLSANSSTASATTQAPPDTAAPTAPPLIQATVVSSTQIDVSWSASTDNVGVTGYQIDRCQSAGCTSFAQIGTSATLSFSSTGLTASTTYRYQVRATDAAGNVSANSTVVTSTTSAPPDTVAPSAPTGVSAAAASTTQINLNWTASTDNVAVTGYQIDRCQGPSCSTFAQIGTSSITTLSDTGLTASTSYSYRVRAVDLAGNVSANSTVASGTTQAPPDTAAPTTPTGLNAAAASGSQVNLAWTASTDNVGVTGYLLERCQGASCANFAQVATPTATTFNDTGLSTGANYSYRIRATDAANNLSAYSTVASATTLSAPTNAPLKLTALLVSATQATLTWQDSNTNGAGFKIERKIGAGSYAQIGTTAANVTTFSDSGLGLLGTAYLYRVRATNAIGDSPNSNEAGVATGVANTTGGSVQYWYDPFGNLIRTDAGGVRTSLSYDRRGRKKGMVDADLGSWSYTYNAAGEMVTQTDAMGQKSEMKYDLLGRMTQRKEYDPNPSGRQGLTSKWFYDAYPTSAPEWDAGLRAALANDCSKGIGKPCYVFGDDGYRRVLSYDPLGRPSETNTFIDTAYKTTTAYVPSGPLVGKVDTVTYPDSFAVKHAYNSTGYLTEVRNTATNALLWHREAGTVAISQTDTVVKEFLGSAAQPGVRKYDILGRLTSTVSAGNNAPLNLAFDYDTVGNVTRRTDVFNGVTENFAYDSLNRLLSASGNNLFTRNFDYDAIGNITYKSDAGLYTYGAPGCGGPHSVTSIAGTVNASYCYDANGNLTSGAGRTIQYFTFNLPRTISQGSDSFQYVYDVEHQRARLDVTRTTGIYTSIYLHPGSGGLFYEKEIKPDGTIEHKHFVNAAGLVGVYVKNTQGVDEMRYFHFDNLGSIVAVTNDAGGLQQGLAYEAYGKRRFPDGTPDPNNTIIVTATDRGYTGHEHLDEIGLIHMNGRVYDPLIGRFMTADVQIQDASNLQAFNRYSYVANNPLSRTDPSGFGWGSKLRKAWHSIKQFDPFSNFLSMMHGIATANLAEAMQGGMHAGNPTSVWVDRYVRNHPNLAPYYTMAMTTACSAFTAGAGAMACAAGATAYTTGLMGGGNSAILKAGAISFATAYAMSVVGDVTQGHGVKSDYFLTANHVANIAGHALVGCASAAASGGDCGSGAMSGAAGSLATPLVSGLGTVGGFVAATVVGGTASELSGGSFANGAKTAAFGYLFNQAGGALSSPGTLPSMTLSPEMNEKLDHVAESLTDIAEYASEVGSKVAAWRGSPKLSEALDATSMALSTPAGHEFYKLGVLQTMTNAILQPIIDTYNMVGNQGLKDCMCSIPYGQ